VQKKIVPGYILSENREQILNIYNLFLKFIIFSGAILSSVLIFLILLIMIFLALPFFSHEGISIFSGSWNPVSGSYGIAPMIAGTVLTAVPALIIAFPLSLGYSVFAAETGNRYLKKPAILLIRAASSIPTVVYAFAGIFIIVPLIRKIGHGGSGYSILSASLVLAVLISPTMIFFFYDSLKSVNKYTQQGALALGASKSEKVLFLLIPSAKRGIFAGVFLGLGRALGDTMISLMLAGNSASFPDSAFESARTLTAHIALVMAADYDSPEFRSVFACGIILYLITAFLSITARYIYKGRIQ
jgi:phosphate transport system permease protein